MDSDQHTAKPRIVGIVNISRDSFSDGGDYSDPDRAAQHARELVAAGADWIELGAASSHPDAADIGAADEIVALRAALERLTDLRDRIGIDTWKPEVQRFGLAENLRFINDISGFEDESIYNDLAQAPCSLVVMHSVQRGKATRAAAGAASMVDRACTYLTQRARALADAGIDRGRLVVDPGMGFFLGQRAESSFEVLKAIEWLRATIDLPVLVSVSRKSFLGSLTGREVADRGAATLAAELYATRRGVDYIRTHDVAALVDGLAVERRLT